MTTDEQKICYYTERLRVLQREARKDGLAIGAGIGRSRRTPYKLTVTVLPQLPQTQQPLPGQLDALGVPDRQNQPIATRSSKDGNPERI